MEKVLFSFYYFKLRLNVLMGKHKTEHPLGLKWRWKHWQRNRQQTVKLF
jgi:hypothetical protein